MDFEVGSFVKLCVIRTFHFGPIQQDLRENTIIEFDGRTMKLGGQVVKVKGEVFDATQLGSAVRAGWLVLVGGAQQNEIQKPASVMIRPAQSTGNERGEATIMTAASEEEKVVGSLANSNAKRVAAAQPGAFNPNEGQRVVSNLTTMDGRRDEATRRANGSFNAAEEAPVAVTRSGDAAPVEISYPGVGNTPKKFLTVQEDGNGQGATIVRSNVKANDPQEAPGVGVPIAKLGSAVKKTVITDSSKAAAEIDRLDSTPPAKASKIESAASVGVPIAKVGSAVKKTLITDSASAARETNRLDDSPPPKAKKFATIAEGEDIRATLPGGATGDVSEARCGDDLTDLLPDAASTGIPASGIAGEGFSWDVTQGHWMTRVKEAVTKYGNNPAIIEKIIVLEGPKIGQRIRDSLKK